MPHEPHENWKDKRKTESPAVLSAAERAFQRLKECPATAAFVEKLREQPSGTTETYYRGHLMTETYRDRTASMYLVAAEAGIGTLVQRRHGDDDYEYIWVRSE